MNKEEMLVRLIHECQEAAKPVDFEELERQGLLAKEGRYYRVPNMWALPYYVSCKITEVCEDPKGTKVKFGKRLEKTAARVLTRMGRSSL